MSMVAFQKLCTEDSDQSDRKRDWICKRKRSYSFDEDHKGHLSKKIRSKAQFDPSGDYNRKRVLDYIDEDEETERNTKCRKTENVKDVHSQVKAISQMQTRDDMKITYFVPMDKLMSLKNYFRSMPTTSWDQYSIELLNRVNNKIQQNEMNKNSVKKIWQYILCEKLNNFSTKDIYNLTNDYDDNISDNLKYCINLTSLESTM
ncbi:hypothetical protein SK128_001557, partial [Halocaridina rubra]